MFAGLKTERARKAVAEVGRARTRAVTARGVDIAAVEERGESGETAVVMWRRRVQYAGGVAVVLESKASHRRWPISVGEFEMDDRAFWGERSAWRLLLPVLTSSKPGPVLYVRKAIFSSSLYHSLHGLLHG